MQTNVPDLVGGGGHVEYKGLVINRGMELIGTELGFVPWIDLNVSRLKMASLLMINKY